MTSHGLGMLERGYDIIPIRQGLKHPGRSDWRKLRCGLRHAAEREERGDMTCENQVGQWAADPRITGIGVLCETVFAIDIDVSDRDVAEQIATWIEDRLGVGVRRIGRAPRVLLVFRCDEPITQGYSHKYRDPLAPMFDDTGKELFHSIDFWGSGRQFVAQGNHPGTGAPYYYENGVDLVDRNVDDLPTITAADLRGVSDAFDRIAYAAGWQRASKADAANLTVIDGGAGLDAIDTYAPKFGATLDEVEALLAKLDPDLPGPQYDMVAKAVYFEFEGTSDLDTAYDILEAWAAGGAKWHDKGSGSQQLKARWRGAESGPPPGTSPIRLATMQKWIQTRTHTVANIDELEAFDGFDDDPETGKPDAAKRSRGLTITPLAEFLADRKPHDWLLRDYLTAHEMAMLFGPPGSYKSFVALDMVLHIATGRDWHGHAVRQAPVLYIAGEGRQGLRARAEAWCAHHGMDPADIPFGITSGAVLLNDASALQAAVPVVQAFVDQWGPLGVFAVDTLARNNTADENDNTAMGIVVSNTTKLMDHFRAAALLIHHSGTGNTERARGASAILGALDSQFRLDREGDGLVNLVCTKMKDAAEPGDKWFAGSVIHLPEVEGEPVSSLVFEETEARSGEEAGDITDPARALKGVRKATYELIAREGPVGRDTLVEVLAHEIGDVWNDDPGKRREQLRAAIVALVGKGLVVAPADGLVSTSADANAVAGFE